MTTKQKMANSDWLNMMVDSLVDNLLHKKRDLGMTTEQAIVAVKKESCAGTKAWAIALKKINEKEVQK